MVGAQLNMWDLAQDVDMLLSAMYMIIMIIFILIEDGEVKQMDISLSAP